MRTLLLIICCIYSIAPNPLSVFCRKNPNNPNLFYTINHVKLSSVCLPRDVIFNILDFSFPDCQRKFEFLQTYIYLLKEKSLLFQELAIQTSSLFEQLINIKKMLNCLRDNVFAISLLSKEETKSLIIQELQRLWEFLQAIEKMSYDQYLLGSLIGDYQQFYEKEKLKITARLQMLHFLYSPVFFFSSLNITYKGILSEKMMKRLLEDASLTISFYRIINDNGRVFECRTASQALIIFCTQLPPHTLTERLATTRHFRALLRHIHEQATKNSIL